MGKDNKEISEAIVRWGPAVVWAGIIFLLSSISTLPGPAVPVWDFFLKKSAHMFMFGVLYFLVLRGVSWGKKYKIWVPAMLITFLYAMSDEYHQSFVPGRTALPTDVGFDTIGMMLMHFRIYKFI